MARKKKHICAECGESFNHGIGLRKHQRQTQHKGSKIVDEGDEEAETPAAPAAAPEPVTEAEAEAAPEPEEEKPARKRRSRREAREEPPPEVDEEENEITVAVNQRLDADDQTAAVSKPSRTATATSTATQVHTPDLDPAQFEETSRFQHNKQKLSVVSRGLRVLFAYRARTAGDQLKQRAVDGVNIFTEAVKLAASLICLVGIPLLILWWWRANHKVPDVPVQLPSSFTFEDAPLAARSALLRYLDNVAKGDFEQAYSALSTSWQQELPPTEFKNAFLDISDLRWAVNEQKLLSNGVAEVSVILAFQEGGVSQRFRGQFRLVQEGQAWKVDRAQLSADGKN